MYSTLGILSHYIFVNLTFHRISKTQTIFCEINNFLARRLAKYIITFTTNVNYPEMSK